MPPALPDDLVRDLDSLIARHGRDAVRAALAALDAGGEDAPAATATGPAPAGASGPQRSDGALSPQASFRLHLLGVPEVYRRTPGGGWEKIAWPFERTLRALVFLATCPDRQAPKQEIVEALWPDADEADEARWRRSFHPTLSHLRRCLRGGARDGVKGGFPVVLSAGVYRLSPEARWWIDADEVVRLADEGAAAMREGREADAVAAWEGAWKLHRGDLLEGVDAPWATLRREELQRRFVGALRALAATYDQQGRIPQALDAYRAALTIDHLQERLHLALMRLYAQLGRRDLVRRQYQRLTRLLREDLGVEPLAETADEYHRLMTGAR